MAFLNVLSKGAFIYYLMRVRGDLEVKELVMAEARAVNGPEKGKYHFFGVVSFFGRSAEVVSAAGRARLQDCMQFRNIL